MTTTIRAARADEIDAIFAVHRDSVSSLCTGHYAPEQIAMWLDGRAPAMYLEAIDSGQMWVAVDDADAIAGFVENDGHEIAKLFVRGDRAGTGVGRRLLEHALAAIRARGHATAYLEATRNACEFYRRHGFVEIGTGTFSRGNSGVALEIVKMERPFAPS
jgi:putative acetyltransferase